jgi:hypothetical protein
VGVVRPRGAHERRGVPQHAVGRGNFARQTLKLDQFARAENRLELFGFGAGGAAKDRDLFVFLRVSDANVEEEPVELRFGQRVRALLLDRVLRREDEERLGRAPSSRRSRSRCAPASPRERGLSPRRCAIDLVASTMLAKIGPRTYRKLRAPVAESSSRISVPVMSLGTRSGVN